MWRSDREWEVRKRHRGKGKHPVGRELRKHMLWWAWSTEKLKVMQRRMGALWEPRTMMEQTWTRVREAPETLHPSKWAKYQYPKGI